jgi:uncharacterized RDD family membrane protein YckC
MTTEAAAAEAEAFPIQGWDAESHPWRRYGARMLDLTLFSFTFFLLLGFPLLFASDEVLSWFEQPTRLTTYLVFQPVSYVLAGVGTALCVARWGATPGKWLFGLKVLGADGERLTLRRAFAREIVLFWWGVGLGFVLLTLIMMIRSFNEVETSGRSRWDERTGSAVLARTLKGRTYAGVVAGAIIVVLLKLWDLFDRFSTLRT